MTFDHYGRGGAMPAANLRLGAVKSSSPAPMSTAATVMPPPKLKVVSLFAGIGGFDRAFDLADGQVVMQCELDRFCRSVLRRHWPDVPMADDIRTLTSEEIPDADIWTAGFPCQDVSLARGNHGRNGFKGDHTSLFFKLMDLIEAKRPPVVLLENVVGLLNSHKGCDFALVLRELTSSGYAVSWRVLNARHYGAPQSRSRVFLCAWQGDYQRALTALFEPTPSVKLPSERLGFMTPTKHSSGAIVPQVSYCVAATSGRHTGNDWSRSYISYADRVRRPTPTESERLQGFPAGWSVPQDEYPSSPVRGTDGERYRALGNAVAVPVVRWIADRITAAWRQPASRRTGRSFADDVSQLAPGLSGLVVTTNFDDIMEDVTAGDFIHRWKTGGCAWGDRIVEASASPAPSKVVPSLFKDILDGDVPDERYFLTPNAAAGILRRADSVGRTLFAPMKHALAMLVAKAPGGKVPAMGESIDAASIRAPRGKEQGAVEAYSRDGPWAY
jgi:DNA (cytosine-5)-methyltransferase 1